MPTISLASANQMIEAAFSHAAELELKPITVTVLDAGGHLIALQRQDGSSILRPEIAIGKASGALALGISSRKIGEMAQERPSFVASLGSIAAAGIIPAAGGLILIGDNGGVIGAIGVTGDLSDNDELCAVAGAEAAGLKYLV